MTDAPDRSDSGYRREPGQGPRLRSDVVDVYLFRAAQGGGVEFLQLLRATPPLDATWQPVMGHVESGETAVDCAVREMREEVGLAAGDPACLGVWALEQVHPYFLAELDAVVLSPRFAVEAAPGWSPTLNDEHDEHRWVGAEEVRVRFTWPGQKAACAEIIAEIARPDSLARERLRLRV